MNRTDLSKICRATSICWRLEPPPRPPPFPNLILSESSTSFQLLSSIISLVFIVALLFFFGIRLLRSDQIRRRLCPSKNAVLSPSFPIASISYPSTLQSEMIATLYEQLTLTNDTTNPYEEIHSLSKTSDHDCLYPNINPYYYTYESVVPHIVCENCLFSTWYLHPENVFVPIKNQ